MRGSLIGRTLVACAGAALIVGAASGCSSDSDDTASSATSSAVATSSAPATADAATTKEITDAYTVFFNGQTPPDQRAALIQNGAAFTPVLQGLTQNPQSTATTVAVKNVTLTDPTHADVTFDLLMGGKVVMPDQSGQAVQEEGTWKVASETFCTLMSVQGDGGQIPACA
ncbi:hypothetical protein AAFP30_08855 [Gordonia sp. CPCC 205515]|uniref:hypothetical protein n=1 Tax=Gordonia sp. CPCC 205515 TaxID=3140791 RepID=UPI003AF3DABD